MQRQMTTAHLPISQGPALRGNERLRKLFATMEIGCKWRPELMYGAEAAAAINILFDQSKFVSRGSSLANRFADRICF